MSGKDLLLINPAMRINQSLFKRDVSELFEKYPPLGLGYLASNCRLKGYKVSIIDLDVEHLTSARLMKRIAFLKPKLIGIECMTSLVSVVIELVQIIKNNFNIPIVIGGPHTSIDSDLLIKKDTIDFLIRGEGEDAIVKLMDYLTGKNIELKNIDNLSYKKNKKTFHNPLSEQKNPDEYPFPDRSLFKNNLYYNPFTRGTKFTSLITSRGCVYNCIFCNPQYKKLKKRSIKNVIDEIKKEIDERDIRNFEIFDETFNFPPKWVMEFCDEVINSKLNISFRIRCRPDFIVSEEMTKKLKKAGCYMISLGIESTNDKTLNFFRKSYTFKQVKNAIKLISKENIEIHGYFILGSPSDSRKEMLDTIDFALKNKIDFANFTILTPIPGTELYRMANEKGLWKDDNKLDYENQIGLSTPLMTHPELSKEEIGKMRTMAYLRFYFRWRSIFNILKLLWFNPLYLFNVLRCQLK